MKSSEGQRKKDPVRSATFLSLDWLAKRVRQANSIRERIERGEYQVNSQEVAESILEENIEQ